MIHAELGASSAHRWIPCPGSVALSHDLPDVPSEHAREGTAAHELAARALNKRLPADTWLGTSIDGFEVTEEMCEAVDLFTAQVWAAMAQDEDASLFIESKFDLSALNPPAPMFGTADAVVYLPTRRKLIVFDLKYGRGVLVEAANNPQTRFYALGALLRFEQRNGAGHIDAIECAIVQPRAHHVGGLVRREELDYLELIAFSVELLVAAERALQPDAPRVPGDWCRWCRARAICPELASAAVAVAQVEFESTPFVPPAPNTLSIEQLATVLDNLDLLEDWIRAVKGHALNVLEGGGEVPGYKLVPKRATRKWVDERAAAEYARAQGMKEIDILEVSLRSVAQIEAGLKRLKRGAKVPEELFNKQSSGNTIAPDSDRRPAVVPITAQDAFTALPPGA